MEAILNKIIEFANALEDYSVGLNSKINIEGLKDDLGEDNILIEKRKERINNRIIKKAGYKLTNDQFLLYFLDAIDVSWSRPAQKPGENILYGGCAFNGLTDALTMKTDFWADSVDEFSQDLSTDNLNFLNKLSWFESPTPHSSSRYTPMYGCFELEVSKFPERLFFYDSATVYKLDMTIESYISNLIDSVAVNCWQYFYIDPEDIIKKNKGINGASWGMSMVVDFPEESDKLDNIIKYMEYCIEYLPTSFPGKDFSFHQERLAILKSKL